MSSAVLPDDSPAAAQIISAAVVTMAENGYHGTSVQQRLFDQVAKDRVDQGVFHTPFPLEASRAVVTMCSTVAGWYNPKGMLSPDEVIARYQDLSLALVGHAPTRRRGASARAPTCLAAELGGRSPLEAAPSSSSTIINGAGGAGASPG